jgi:hypothetical protein
MVRIDFLRDHDFEIHHKVTQRSTRRERRFSGRRVESRACRHRRHTFTRGPDFLRAHQL